MGGGKGAKGGGRRRKKGKKSDTFEWHPSDVEMSKWIYVSVPVSDCSFPLLEEHNRQLIVP